MHNLSRIRGGRDRLPLYLPRQPAPTPSLTSPSNGFLTTRRAAHRPPRHSILPSPNLNQRHNHAGLLPHLALAAASC